MSPLVPCQHQSIPANQLSECSVRRRERHLSLGEPGLAAPVHTRSPAVYHPTHLHGPGLAHCGRCRSMSGWRTAVALMAGCNRSTHAFTSSEFATHHLRCRTHVAQLGICHGPAEVPESAVRSYQEPVRRDDVETPANVARDLLHRLHLGVLGIDHTDSQDLVGGKVPESVKLCVSPVAHLYMDHIGGRCLEDWHHLGGLILEDVALAVDAAVANMPELRHLDALEEGLLHLYLPHLLRVGGQYIDQLNGLQPDALEILELLVHSRC